MKCLTVATSYELANGRHKFCNVQYLQQVMKWPTVATSCDMSDSSYEL